MTVHVIEQRDWRADAPRRIVWDDETGEVSGDHRGVPAIRRLMERAVRDGGRLQDEEGHWQLRDPRRDPASFVVLLWRTLEAQSDQEAMPEPLRSADPRPMFVASRLTGVVF